MQQTGKEVEAAPQNWSQDTWVLTPALLLLNWQFHLEQIFLILLSFLLEKQGVRSDAILNKWKSKQENLLFVKFPCNIKEE